MLRLPRPFGREPGTPSQEESLQKMADIIRTVCAHDCPDMCSLLVRMDDGRVIRVQGDPDQPFTAGFVCGKVAREPELVHSPDRLAQPLRRRGLKGAGEFE